jgi:sugar phosphate isomerase/epimerase
MWGIGRFDDMAEFAERSLILGADAVEVNYQVYDEGFREIVSTGVAISSLHCCAPNPRKNGKSDLDRLNLSSTDEALRRHSVSRAYRTIDSALQVGAKSVIVHLGETSGLHGEENNLRTMAKQGLTNTDEYKSALEELLLARTGMIGPHLEAAERSLRTLSSHADAVGIRIGLENRLDIRDIPSLDEVGHMITQFGRRGVGYWHDVGHAVIQERLGMQGWRSGLERFPDHLIGLHVHDVRSLTDHLAPGVGDVDLQVLSTYISPGATVVGEFSSVNSEREVARGLTLMRACGLHAPACAPSRRA